MEIINLETYIDKKNNYYGSFLIEPLNIGQALTIGNALRRTLLSEITGFSITGLRINNVKHEFSTIDGVREDTLEIILNLKEIIFKHLVLPISKSKILQISKIEGFLKATGPVVVTAGMFNLPKSLLKILNPNQYICTLASNRQLYIEIDIEKGCGYLLSEEKHRNLAFIDNTNLAFPLTLSIDASFLPIQTVNYKVKLIHDSLGNIKESLYFEIITNGSITPKRSLQEATKILVNLYSSLLVSDSLMLFSEISKKKVYTQEKND